MPKASSTGSGGSSPSTAPAGLALLLLGHRQRLMFTTLPANVVAPVVQGGTPLTLFALLENSTMSKDIFGREFVVPVDKEHKATECGCHTLFVTANPHMRAFHVSWFGFFASFYSTFAAASLNAYMIPDLNLNEGEWALGNTLAICGTIFFRIVMGWICDKFGARRGLGYLLLATSPACVLMMFINSGWQMILLRTIIGFSLATFVACQTWCSQIVPP